MPLPKVHGATTVKKETIPVEGKVYVGMCTRYPGSTEKSPKYEELHKASWRCSLRSFRPPVPSSQAGSLCSPKAAHYLHLCGGLSNHHPLFPPSQLSWAWLAQLVTNPGTSLLFRGSLSFLCFCTSLQPQLGCLIPVQSKASKRTGCCLPFTIKWTRVAGEENQCTESEYICNGVTPLQTHSVILEQCKDSFLLSQSTQLQYFCAALQSFIRLLMKCSLFEVKSVSSHEKN